MRYFIILSSPFLLCLHVFAGGNNDQVNFPGGYNDTFVHYHTMNRTNGKQIADLYANELAVSTAKDGELADGSIIVMEVYSPQVDEAGKPVVAPDGFFKKAALAAVAVMEKRSDWGVDYPAEQRAGDWGFALYTPDGKPKENDLACQSCHQPQGNQNFMYTFSHLSGN